MDIPAEIWARVDNPRVVIDCWRALGVLRDVPGIIYLALGTGEPASSSRARTAAGATRLGRPVSPELALFSTPKTFSRPLRDDPAQRHHQLDSPRPAPGNPALRRRGRTAEIAAEFGIRHFPEVARNEFGTPLLDDLFRQAGRRPPRRYCGYVNADIVLTGDFSRLSTAFRPVSEIHGRRPPLGLRLGSAARLLAARLGRDRPRAREKANVQRPGNFIDYFCLHARDL